MGVLLFVFACSQPGDSTAKETGDTDHTIDSTDSAVEVDGVTVSATAKETVFRVTWSTTEPTTSAVEYSTDDSYDHTATGTDSADGLDHEVLLILAEGLTWSCRATSPLSDGPWVSETFAIETPSAPADMPGLELSSDSTSDLDGFLLVANAFEGESWVSIVDRLGRRIWWEQGSDVDLFSEVWLTPDKKSMVWNSMGVSEQLHIKSLDGSSDVTLDLHTFHHDFVPLPEGGYVILRYKHILVDGVDVVGDEVVEIDANGVEQRVVWDVFEDFIVNPADFPPDVTEVDFSHANSISYYEDSNIYLISLYELNTVVAIDRETGDYLWKVGGETSDFEYMGDASEVFARQHSPRLVDGGLLVFNNRDVEQSADDRWSEAAEYSLDFENHLYRKVWSYDAEKAIYAPALGNADRQDDGSTLVGWGSAGRASQVDADGNVLWQVDSDLGGPFGYIHLIDSLAGATR